MMAQNVVWDRFQSGYFDVLLKCLPINMKEEKERRRWSTSLMKIEKGFFSSSMKGEQLELRTQLQGSNIEQRVSAMNKILTTTMKGSSLDSLFTDVLNCAQTHSIKLKKLVFLYLTNCAHRNHEPAMLAVNTLSRDLMSQQPYVRALALRTAVGMDVPSVTEQMVSLILQSLEDSDPYVRKTAAMAVARLYQSQQTWAEDMGFVERLIDMLSDSNIAVLVNVIAALMDMKRLQLEEFGVVQRILAALNESHEWGQVAILDAVSSYQAKSTWEAQSICDRVSPYLIHANSAVVLTAIRVMLLNIDLCGNDINIIIAKLSSSLKTLLTTEPAIQYVALRNIHIILKKYPDLMKNDLQVFFLKYNEPIYVKLEKLDIIVKLVDISNITLVLSELEEYSNDIDIELVRKSILTIGKCAIKLQHAAHECVQILMKLINNNINYITESVIVALRDIFRKYPKKFDQALNSFNDGLEEIQDIEARAAFVWIIGEYADRITDVDLLLEGFVNNFLFDSASVQLATLTAVVKAFLLLPQLSDLVHRVLLHATSVGNPDLRDRGFIYWRLLSTDPIAAHDIVLSEKPPIIDETDVEGPLDIFIKELGTLTSVYHKPSTKDGF